MQMRPLLAALLLTVVASPACLARGRHSAASHPDSPPGAPPAIEVAFSPEAGAEDLVLRVIRSAKRSLRLAGYSFTSPSVVRALLEAKQRGVDVAVLVDYQDNLRDARYGISRRALSLLAEADIPTRTISIYAIHHDKYIIVDEHTVETGSFNYTMAAAMRNSENVLVVWGDVQLAQKYLAHWKDRWENAQPYRESN